VYTALTNMVVIFNPRTRHDPARAYRDDCRLDPTVTDCVIM
jgi:hypothetical protein